MSGLAHIVALLRAGGVPEAEHEAARLLAANPANLDEIIARRVEGVPLGHLLGSEEWMGIEITVSPEVLAPRKETELLARTAIAHLKAIKAPVVIDMCCGSGNLGCAIAHYVADSRVFACDLTDACVALARENAAKLALADRLTVHQGDLFDSLVGENLTGAVDLGSVDLGSVDLVVCNPPYISSSRLEKDRATLLQHEPRAAFDGGPYGLTIQQRVIREAAPFVKAGGALAFEIGEGQDRQITTLFARAKRIWADVELVNDENGTARVAVARRTAVAAQG